MKRALWVVLAGLAATFVWIISAYLRDIGAARRRAGTGSAIAATSCGAIEYADRGTGPAVLVVHGAGGGFDQGMLLGDALVQRGYRVIAPSRFGYLRTPLPADASAEAQAEAHACLLTQLGIERAAVWAVSAGAPSATELCVRHPERCSALVLMVPLAYSGLPVQKTTGAEAPSRTRMMTSDFAFWAFTRIARDKAVEVVLGTPMSAFRVASPADQQHAYAMLDTILPLSLRADGLLNEMKVAESLQPLPLEQITAPTLIASSEDDGYRTLPGARYLAEHIRGARLIVYPSGGHLLMGHEAGFLAEILALFGGAS